MLGPMDRRTSRERRIPLPHVPEPPQAGHARQNRRASGSNDDCDTRARRITRPVLGAFLALLTGCASAHVDDCEGPRVFDCEPDDGAGLVEGHRYELEPAISTCALCRRAELAFDARAAELGCCEPFPLDACPLEAAGPFEGCLVWQAELHATFIREAISCELLLRRAGTVQNWSGFECGGRFCYVPPLVPEIGQTLEEARAYCGGR